MKNKPIGVLDSGIGGLSIYQEIVKLLPHESTLYIGDNAYIPYSKLSEEVLFDRSKRLVRFLLEKDAKLIVVACNTITVSGIDKLRETFPDVPFIGTVPVIKTAASVTQKKSFGILSTERTANSAYQKDLINKFAEGHTVLNIGTDELVPLIEKGIVEGKAMHDVLNAILVPFKEGVVDTLVLGCTHYPFVKKEIQNILGSEVQILDSGAAIARQAQRILSEKNALSTSGTPTREYYTTAMAEHIDYIAKKLLGITITSTTVTL